MLFNMNWSVCWIVAVLFSIISTYGEEKKWASVLKKPIHQLRQRLIEVFLVGQLTQSTFTPSMHSIAVESLA